MAIGSWLLTFLIMCIPVVGLVMMFVWAFGSGNQTRATYFKAMLIWALIMTVLYFVFAGMITGLLMSMM